jgi:hypothetical protein
MRLLINIREAVKLSSYGLIYCIEPIFNEVYTKDIGRDKDSTCQEHRRVHMANERTFLSWIRTSIGIMAFGFVVENVILRIIAGLKSAAFRK